MNDRDLPAFLRGFFNAFGRDGAPFYVSGPYDNAAAVTRTLTRSVGTGNFHFIAEVEASAGW